MTGRQRFPLNALLALLLIGPASCHANTYARDVGVGPIRDAQVDGVAAVRNWARYRVLEAEGAFVQTGLSRTHSPTSWAGVVVYQIVVDRFNNGDPRNDHLNVPDAQRKAEKAGDATGLPDWRHGGDLEGIRQRLGYLEDLGVQTLWISPVLMHNGEYHGYCTTNPVEMDPGFGTPEEFRWLIAEAHTLGISVVLDIVVNHLCDRGSSYTSAPDHENCAELWNASYWTGSPRGNGSLVGINFSSSFFPPFRSTEFFNRCGPNSVADTSGETPAAIFGDFVDGMFDFNTQNQDFKQIFTDFVKYWIAFLDLDGVRLDAAKHVTNDFIASLSTSLRGYARTLGKDNFLVVGEEASKDETWKAMALGRMMSDPSNPVVHGHIPATVTMELRRLKDHYLANPAFPAPGLTSLYNFNLSGTARDALRCESTSRGIEDYFSSYARRVLMSESVPQRGAEKDAHLWTCVELHDWPRFLGTAPDKAGLLRAALAWLITAPGAPILYYGAEQALNGNCPEEISIPNLTQRLAVRAVCDAGAQERYGSHPDALKRQDMFARGPWRLGSAVPEVAREAFVGTHGGNSPEEAPPGDWHADPMLPRSHDFYVHVRRLVALRRSCPSIATGKIVWHAATWLPCGFLAFSRYLDQNISHDPLAPTGEAVVLINPGGSSQDAEVQAGHITLRGDLRRSVGESYVNAFNQTQVADVGLRDGVLTLEFQDGPLRLAPGESAVFLQAFNLKTSTGNLGTALCDMDGYPAHLARDGGAGKWSGAGHKWLIFVASGAGLFVILALLAWGLSTEKSDCAAQPRDDVSSDSDTEDISSDGANGPK